MPNDLLSRKVNPNTVLLQTLLTKLAFKEDKLSLHLTQIRDFFTEKLPSIFEFLSKIEQQKLEELKKKLLPKLQQPALLLPTAPGTTTTLLEELINEIEAYFNVLTHPGLKPLLRLLDSIVKDYRLSLKNWQVNPDLQFSTPYASITGDSLGFYALPLATAFQIICRNSDGNKTEKQNDTGNREVFYAEIADDQGDSHGIYFKPNQASSRLHLCPGTQYSVQSLFEIITGPYIAPSTLLKLTLPRTSPEQASMEWVVQASLKAGPLSLEQLLMLLQNFQGLMGALNKEELIALLPELINGDYYEALKNNTINKKNIEDPSLDAADLLSELLVSMQSLEKNQRLRDFIEADDASYHTSYLKNMAYMLNRHGKAKIGIAILLIKKFPQLAKAQCLIDIIKLPNLFKLIPTLLPKATPEEIYNELPNFLDRWDFYNFCSFILVYSIFPPEDGKADNYCLRLHYDPTGKISHFELIGFDEDQRTTHKINFRNNKHYPLFKCLLFAFEKMMRRRFDPQLRERFLQIAKLILLRWLADLKRQNDLYQKLIYSGILNVNDLLEQNFELNTEGQEASLLDVPIKLDPDDVPFMLARIHRITEVLQNPDISCWDLFRATEPLLAEFYQWAMQCANNNIMQIQTILFCGDSSFESTFAEKYSATPELASQQQLELERYTLSIDDLESRRTETVSSAAIKLIQLMNFDDYQAESPELWEILQLIAGYFPFIAAPKINQTLLDELLRLSLVKKAAPITGLVLQWGAVFNQPPSLAEINLKHCKAITEDALLQLIKASPQLRFLDISGCSLLSVEILAPLLQLCPLLQTLSLNQLRWKHIAIHHKTLQQIHFNECMRLQDVQLYTPKLSLLENNNCPKLKQCVIFPYSQMPRTLANSRNLAIISLTNYKDKTIKSRTLLAYNIDNTTDYIKSMECTTTGNIFTVNSAQIVYWDAHQDYKTTIIGKNLKRFTCSTYLTNGLIAIGCHDHNIYLYDPNNNTNVNPLPIATLSGHIKSISALASKDWLLISASDEDSCLRFWDLRQNQLKSIKYANDEKISALSVKDNQLIVGTASGILQYWEIRHQGEKLIINFIKQFKAHSSQINAILFLDDNNFTTASSDKTVKLWQIHNEQFDASFQRHNAAVTCLCRLAPDIIASGSKDTTINIWQLSQRKLLRTLKGHTAAVTALRTANNALISASDDSSVIIWNFPIVKLDLQLLKQKLKTIAFSETDSAHFQLKCLFHTNEVDKQLLQDLVNFVTASLDLKTDIDDDNTVIHFIASDLPTGEQLTGLLSGIKNYLDDVTSIVSNVWQKRRTTSSSALIEKPTENWRESKSMSALTQKPFLGSPRQTQLDNNNASIAPKTSQEKANTYEQKLINK